MAESGSDIVETDIESSHPLGSSMVNPQITLSFDSSNGGAWDDRELINAYDAAMDEFHVSCPVERVRISSRQLHHPGPGSWLDKAMAAQRKGEPLPGARPTTTA